ncbi:hypothetical protein N657DRAFT_655682 [Parathielavia appendiculata]|uniref:Uncharacterized protein n=1 Tax=Parathielavia appendiculata TaxID=2587402 RepID=A0AAN6Z4E6_9PEZI|nr:hypothetical protein N657DRAFT_655682 [Parathielavia appendiculata]
MTPSIVEGLQTLKRHANQGLAVMPAQDDHEPSLKDPTVGNPISHLQVVDLWSALKVAGAGRWSLEVLLKGSKVYVPPPPPKAEPSDEYKALMARLRREQEQREYECMTNPLPPTETFAQRFPNGANMAQAFAAVNRPSREVDMGDDDVTYGDVHRQLMLILNFVASILGVAATLWILARWWSTPARLFLTMGGSALVGIAEVAVYSGYVWHLGMAKKKDQTLKEVKQIVQSWTLAPDGDEAVAVGGGAGTGDTTLRRRLNE